MSHHLTEDQICSAIAGQSTIDEQRHIHGCAACRAEVERSLTVLAAFRLTVAKQADQDARRSQVSLDAGRTARGRWEWALAGTAVIAVVAAVLSQMPRQAPALTTAVPGPPVVIETEFFPLAYSNVPVTNGHLVRLEVPSSSLAAFGLDPADAVSPRPGAVLADVVVGEDGLARAVRFVRPSEDAPTLKEKQP
jgi:hypothetical protein